MISKNSDNGKKSFLHMLLSYISVLFIPIVIGALAYNIAFHAIENAVVESNTAVLRQSMEVLEQRLEEVDSIAEQLSLDPKIKSFLYLTRPFNGSNVYKILETRKSLYDYKMSNNFIVDYYLFFKNSDIVLAPNLTYTIPDFYDQYFKYDGLDYNQWYDKILGKYYSKQYLPSMPVILNKQSRSMITYIQSLGYKSFYQGAIVVLIDNNEIQNLLKNINISNGGWAYIADQNNQIITSVSSTSKTSAILLESSQADGVTKQAINGEDMLITYVTSNRSGWQYVAVQPTDVVLEEIAVIKKVILTIVLISIALGVFVAYLLAYKNNIPIKRILEAIKNVKTDSRRGDNVYDVIQDTLTSLIDKNKNLQTSMEQQIPFLKTAFFERLLRGEFYTKEQLNAIMRYIDVSLVGKYYTVIILFLSGYHDDVSNEMILIELDRKKVIIKDIIRKIVENNGYPHDVEEDKVALILACDAENVSEYRKILEQTVQKMREDLENAGIDVTFAIGGIFGDILDISSSYQQARQALNMYTVNAKTERIIWYDNIPSQGKYYYYSVDTENKLINFTKSCKKDEVTKMLFELYSKNIAEQCLSPGYIISFMYELYGSIVKIMEQTGIRDKDIDKCVIKLPDKINAFDDINAIYNDIVEVYCMICDFIEKSKKSHNNNLIREIVDYLQASYMNSNICLTTVAERFSLSDIYLSQFFKEQTGQNFSDYIETIRIKQAIDLLISTNLTITEIAEKVGYCSTNTFCRAFKRINGISATKYRQSIVQRSIS
jgi:YesN/AraC family two-component response regulator